MRDVEVDAIVVDQHGFPRKSITELEFFGGGSGKACQKAA